VMMSGLDRGHVRERALRAGAHAFLAKPLSPEELFKSLGGTDLPQWDHSSSSSSL
jgi:CheY-like chemotaxis protein